MELTRPRRHEIDRILHVVLWGTLRQRARLKNAFGGNRWNGKRHHEGWAHLFCRLIVVLKNSNTCFGAHNSTQSAFPTVPIERK